MKTKLLLLATCAIAGLSSSTWAQTAKSYEYTQSSSPTKSGAIVTSRTQAGKPTETRVFARTTAAMPPQQASIANQTAAPVGSGVAANFPASSSPTGQTGSAVGPPANSIYPYPTYSVVTPQYQQYQRYPPTTTTAPGSVWVPGSTIEQPVLQVPTLGINSNTLLRPNISAFAVQPGVDQNAASTPPGLNIEVPGAATSGTAPSIQYPQPAWPGSIAATVPQTKYRPLINLRNLPPSTYVGQGIVGQPKAYVDGQPVRNLFRYIMP